MKINLNKTNQNYEIDQMLSSDREVIEKSQKVAIDAIILYLKSINNTVCLKRTYSTEEAFENLDLITQLEDYQCKIQIPNKKRKKSLETSSDCALDIPLSVQSVKVTKEVQRDFHLVLQAVQRDGLELQYASRRLQNNDLIVFHAVRQNGLALQYVPYILRDRFDIVAAAVRQNSLAFSFASKRLQNDAEIIEFARGSKKTNSLYTEH